MTLATFKDLCLDAIDVELVGRFWSAALGRPFHRRDDGIGRIDHDVLHTLWINPVPEPKQVKNRVHLDVHAPSVQLLIDLGATPGVAQETFQVVLDPAGNELCVFPDDGPPIARPFALCVDAASPVPIAAWWADVLGAELGPGPDGTRRYLHGAAGMDGLTMKFVPVDDLRQVKNRCHWDVTVDDVDALVDRGAAVLRRPDDDIRWTILADPDGNEFCAFGPGR